MSKKNNPIKKLKIGRVNASVFENTTERGTWYSISLDRVYKDGEGFKRVSSFPDNELDNLELTVQLLKQFVAEQRG